MMTVEYNGERAYFVPTNSPEDADVDMTVFKGMHADFVEGWNRTGKPGANNPPLTADSPSLLFPGMTMGEVIEASKSGEFPDN